MVSLIASLSGRDISLETSKEFIFSMGGVAGAGYVFRLAAQQSSKLLNVVWPGSGTTVSSLIAAYLAIVNASSKWTQRMIGWDQILD